MTKRPINLRLDEDLVQAVDELAKRLGTDRTDLITQGMRRELLYDGSREFVYVLLDDEQNVRYVGRSRNPHIRLREHLAGARAGGASAKEAWIQGLLAAERVPGLAIIDDAEPGDAIRELEAEWIDHFRQSGRLTNGSVAGVAARARRETGVTILGLRMSDEQLASLDRLVAAVREHYEREAADIPVFAELAKTTTRSSALRDLLLAWEHGKVDVFSR